MAKLRKRDRGAGIRYFIRTADGHELAAGRDLQTARDILAHYRNLETLLRHGVPIPMRSAWTLQKLSEWDQSERTEDSRRRRWNVILDTLGKETPLEEIEPGLLMAYGQKRKLAGAGAATINRDLSVLAAALKRSRGLSGYQKDPFAGLPRLKEQRPKPTVWPPKAIFGFLNICRRLAGRAGKRHRAEWLQNADMIEVLYLTASRLSQVLGLRWDQVRGELLYFPPHKGGLERWFRMDGRLGQVLGGPELDGGFVFPSTRTAGAREGFRRFWEKACTEAKMPMTRHSLRASRASAWFAEGKSIADVQRLLGHASPQMALRLYVQLFPDSLPTLLPTETGVKEATLEQQGAKKTQAGIDGPR